MDNPSNVARVIFYSIFFILPVAGATLWLTKLLFKYILNRKKLRDCKTTSKSELLFIILGFITSTLGVFLCLFMAVTMFFPSYEISKITKVFGGILSMLYFGFICFLYGLGRTVAAGAGSATGILNKLVNILSVKDEIWSTVDRKTKEPGNN
jgi:hypothetical protein